MAMMLGLCVTTAALATNIELYEFDSPQQEAQYRGLIEELRCPKCQNQNLAASDAPIAQDLKQKTYEMVKDGRTDTEIRNYMFERYGDFISYKPPVRPSTWILWFFPPVLLVLLILGWLYKAKKGRAATVSDTAAPLSASEEEKLAKILSQHQDRLNHSTKSTHQDSDKA
ncbi:cytochrome c-type biogenesis protein [Moraxella porci]|uniref:cytochrome c-type biogenesis protein n=1 Tax=Moraxella porci TaxID=1288392 RepID=UPI00244A1C15|nr:cytochrome c-type biogenesis protein CcmH [Moraxella porci]MDH2273474.1 cytochrome c-type biogenesis protein CcmH [Moraxella porci]